MKKLLVIALALMLVATPAFALSIKAHVNNFNAGSTSDKEEATVMVYNATGAALASGDVLTWYTNASYDDGRSVTKANRMGQKVCGVANEAIAANSWGNMLVYGYHSAVKVYCGAGYTITEGYPLYAYGDSVTAANSASTYDGYAGQAIANASIIYPAEPFGQVLDSVATATATTVEAFIDCL